MSAWDYAKPPGGGAQSMNYKSIADLNKDVKKWLEKLPKDFDIIVGIPRSGLLVANLLALYLNVPMTDLDGLIAGRILSGGKRLKKRVSFDEIQKALVVDDSVYGGTSMTEAKEKIKSAKLPFDVKYGAVYVTASGTKYVDYWYEILDPPRIFEWNVLHHSILQNSCVDIDGVLCRDPTPEENDDGEKYRKFIQTVEPNFIPTVEIGWIVSSRLEKYRKETEQWLKKHGIKYKELVLLDLPDSETRARLRAHAKHKAEVYRKTGADLFIESSRNEALEIARLSGKPVLCYTTGELITPVTARILAREKYKIRKFLRKLKEDPYATIKRIPKYAKIELEEFLIKLQILISGSVQKNRNQK